MMKSTLQHLYLLLLALALLPESAAAATIQEVTGLPSMPEAVNPSVTTNKRSILNAGTSIGQTFSITGPLDITTFTFQLASNQSGSSADFSGSLTTSIFNIDAGGLPTGAALFTDTGALPASGLAADDFLEVSFNAPITFSTGTYAVVLETSDLDFFLNVSHQDAFVDHSLIIDTGTGWQEKGSIDLVFAIEGTAAVPEPSGSILFSLGGILLLIHRRRV